MTAVALYPSNVPVRQDPSGRDQAASSDDALASAGKSVDAFETMLRGLAQKPNAIPDPSEMAQNASRANVGSERVTQAAAAADASSTGPQAAELADLATSTAASAASLLNPNARQARAASATEQVALQANTKAASPASDAARLLDSLSQTASASTATATGSTEIQRRDFAAQPSALDQIAAQGQESDDHSPDGLSIRRPQGMANNAGSIGKSDPIKAAAAPDHRDQAAANTDGSAALDGQTATPAISAVVAAASMAASTAPVLILDASAPSGGVATSGIVASGTTRRIRPALQDDVEERQTAIGSAAATRTTRDQSATAATMAVTPGGFGQNSFAATPNAKTTVAIGSIPTAGVAERSASSLSESDGAPVADGSNHASSTVFGMTIAAVSSATHFAPVARLSPAQQIVDAVATAAAPITGTSSVLAAASPPPASETEANVATSVGSDLTSTLTQSSAGSVKTLDLQLQPETLGTITVKLNLSDAGLAVQLQAAHQQTADLLEKDKQSLVQGLSDSGYSVTSLDVTTSPQQGSHLSGDGAPQEGQADANNGQFGGGQTAGHGGSPNGDRRAHDSPHFAESARGAQTSADQSGGSVRAGSSGSLFI